MPLQSSSKLGTTCSTAPPSHQFLCPEALGRHMTLEMMKDERQMKESEKANIHISKSWMALLTILGIFWRILQISSVISEHLLWCFCYILSLIYIFVIDIFLSFYCKIVKKSKTETCPFVDPSESGKIRGS